MNVLHEIAAWAKKVPSWQSDAIRRIFTQDALSAADEDELLRMLLVDNGIAEDDQEPVIPKPFADVISDTSSNLKAIVLKEIHSVSGVNALVPDQAIGFALEGLTIIYGDNGAGKSGYARVFKHACHAREKGEPILANVAVKLTAKPRATIELSVDNEDIAIEWVAGTPASDILSQIAVFDSHCARVFLDEANEVVYLPYGMDVFGRLVKLCEALKTKIQKKIAETATTLSVAAQFREGTAAGKFVRGLSDKSDIAHLDKLIALTSDDKERLTLLKTLVASAKSNPPKSRAAELRRQKQRLEQLRVKIVGIESVIETAVVTRLRELAATAAAASKAALLASTEAFTIDPLPGTGTEPWRILFDAAKAFSEQSAYQGKTFPVSEDGSLCVWCQQPLSPEASDRLARFQTFVTDDAAKKKDAADSALAVATTPVSALNVQLFAPEDTLLDELRTFDSTLATSAESFVKAAQSRKDNLLSALVDGKWDSIPALPASIAPALKTALASLEAVAVDVEKTDNPLELKKLQDELAELEDRQLLATNEADVRKVISSKQKEVKLRAAERARDTGQITKVGNELMAKAVTEQMITTLERELEDFAVQCVPLKLRNKGDRGTTKHQLTIESGASPTGVLSEGEQRIVAIASFLAELETAGGKLPIIFDDPVSSLDHRFRERVAARLAKEAMNRQVIIFTHDIVMLLALEDACAELGVSSIVQTVRRSALGPGQCPRPAARPWHASSTKDRIGQVKQESAGFKKLSQEGEDKYRSAVAEVFGKLREAWERAIEEWLFNDAILRFRPSIETKRLSKVIIETNDYVSIENGMSKCSAELTGHDKAAARNSPAPTPEDVAEAIKALEDFMETMKARQNLAAASAKARTEPPKPKLSNTRATNIIKMVPVAAIP